MNLLFLLASNVVSKTVMLTWFLPLLGRTVFFSLGASRTFLYSSTFWNFQYMCKLWVFLYWYIHGGPFHSNDSWSSFAWQIFLHYFSGYLPLSSIFSPPELILNEPWTNEINPFIVFTFLSSFLFLLFYILGKFFGYLLLLISYCYIQCAMQPL